MLLLFRSASGSAGGPPTLQVSTGVFNLTGQQADLLVGTITVSLSLQISPGEFILTGVPTGLTKKFGGTAQVSAMNRIHVPFFVPFYSESLWRAPFGR